MSLSEARLGIHNKENTSVFLPYKKITRLAPVFRTVRLSINGRELEV